MAVKSVITKVEYAKLPEALKGEYIEDGDSYRLDLEGGENVDALKRAKDHEKTERQKAEKKARDLQAALDAKEAAENQANGDVEKINASWQKKLTDAETAAADALKKRDGFIQKTLVDNVASRIASEISVSPAILMPHVKSRLAVEMVDGEPVTKVLDANGAVSALTLDQLKAEFTNNKDFAPIIVGSKASGGRQTTPGGASTQQQQFAQPGEKVDVNKLSPSEMRAYLHSKNPTGV